MSDGDLIPTNVENEDDKAIKAYDYRMSGATWNTVAEKMGYVTATQAQRAVTKLIRKAAATVTLEQREEIMSLELDRLDALQESLWGIALAGDFKAVDSVLKIMNHRAKLLKLDGEQASTTNTIVISSDNYSESLQQVT